MELEICGVTKQYKDKCAVDNVSLKLTPGVWGLLGANGAGKTTLMRMLAAIQRPTSGCIRYDGIEIGTLKEAYRDIFGYLPQEFGFYPGFCVQDYLEYVAALKGLTRTEAKERIRTLLERVSLAEVRNKKISRLSGGMKRRVGIAQALLNEPEVLVLDEPTSGLDPLMQREFFEILKERNAQGTTIFLSSHVLSEIQRNCTRAAIIREGKLIACDSVEALSRTSAKRVHVQGELSLPEWKEVRDLRQTGSGISFLYGGEIRSLLRVLAEQDITDLTISEPDLEEIFLHYYLDPEGDRGMNGGEEK